MIWFLLIVVVVGLAIWVEHKKVLDARVLSKWSMKEPMKKGGSYSIYYMDKHIANVRGKMKALVLIHAIKGMDITDKLDMEMSKSDKKVMKKVMDKKKKVVGGKKTVSKKVVKKPMAKKVKAKAKK